MDEQKDTLKRQIQTQIELLSTMEEGSEEKYRETQILEKLYQLEMEHEKMIDDREAANHNRMVNEAERQHRELFDYIQVGVKVVGGVATTVAGIVILNGVMKFEETGTLTSKASQIALRCFNPFKK